MGSRALTRLVVLTVAGVIGLLALVVWLPYLTRTHAVVLATPGPPPIDQPTPIALPAGKGVCVDNVTLQPQIRTVRTRFVAPVGAVGGPIDFVLIDPAGHTVGAGTAPKGLTVPATIDVPIKNTLKQSVVGRLCLGNHGPALTAEGTDEPRLRTRSNTFVDGKQVVGGLRLELRGRSGGLTSRIGDILGLAANFKPVTPWEVYALAILLLLGLPAGIMLVLVHALRADRRRP